eukprot:TRINITY_DN15215_c4_g1_i1.p1 TRINITY_DN15215_c4_g1~~TRINITY_DN15215_c4_g1_i1.p1  ORF type:complete len:391 (+),score=50.37 TRINITY_DN15215_c4_g1_i1:78-1175(+)
MAHVQGSPKMPARSPHRPSHAAPAPAGGSPEYVPVTPYDAYDRAPEDRRRPPQRQQVLDFGLGTSSVEESFESAAHIVRGVLTVDGVNYAHYGAYLRTRPRNCDHFLDGLRDDIISEVGNGLRRADILLRVSPGPVRSLALEFDLRQPPQHAEQADVRRTVADWSWQDDPVLADADWSMHVDYAIRARNEQRQLGVAAALYRCLAAPGGLPCRATRRQYTKCLDPDRGPSRHIVVRRIAPTAEEAGPPPASRPPLLAPVPGSPSRYIPPGAGLPCRGAPAPEPPLLQGFPEPGALSAPSHSHADPHPLPIGQAERSPQAQQRWQLQPASPRSGSALLPPGAPRGRAGVTVVIPEETFSPQQFVYA